MEVFFITGPLIAALLIALGSPALAVLGITALKTAGVLAFAATPASRAWRGAEVHVTRHWAGPLTSPGIRTMLLADVPFGAMFGAIDVAVPAFAKATGSAASAGFVLAALAVGSMIGGSIYGSRPRRLDGIRYAQLATLQALFVLPLVAADSIAVLAIGMAAAGLFVAPLSTIGFGLTDVVRPPGTDTEASSWTLTAYQFGLAGGTALAGTIVEGSGTTAAFALAAGCAAFSAAVLWLRRRTMAGYSATATAS
jgi:predicted MFS family arabinose efflux permease